MTEAEILEQFGRSGWRVISRTPITEKVTVPGLGSEPATTENKPTGRYRWVLSGPGGESDEVVVRTSADPTSTTPGAVSYEVVKPPKKAPPKSQKRSDVPTRGTTRITEKGGTLYQKVVVDDVGTWSIDLSVQPRKLEKDAQGRQLVRGDNGALYEYDGQGGLLELKAGTSPEKRVSVVGNRVFTTDPETGQSKVSFEAPAGWTLHETAEGIVAINPQTQETRMVREAPATTSVLTVPSTQPTVTTQQGPGGAISSQPNPGYVAPGQKLLQDAQATVAEIDRQVAAGTLSEQDAAALKAHVNDALITGLQGTTPAALATQQIDAARAEADRLSRERIMDADRTSREAIAAADRASREAETGFRGEVEQRNNDQTAALDWRGQDITAQGNALSTVRGISDAAVRAMMDSLPFYAPKGTAQDLTALHQAFATGERPQGVQARAAPMPFDPKTIAYDAARMAAAALADISPSAAAMLKENPGSGYTPAPRIPFQPPKPAAPASTSPAASATAEVGIPTGWSPATNTTPYDHLTDAQKDAINAYVRAKPASAPVAPPPEPVPVAAAPSEPELPAFQSPQTIGFWNGQQINPGGHYENGVWIPAPGGA